jgi:hypothetical protein
MSTSSQMTAGAQAEPPSNPLSPLVRIFFSPADAFVLRGKRPWLIPLAAACLMALTMNVIVVTGIGMETIMRNQFESRPELVERLGQDRIDQMARDAGSPARKWISFASALIVTAILLAIVAGLLLGGLLATGAEATYGAILTVCALSWFAYLTVQTIATAVFIASVRDYSGVDMQNLIALNPTLFVDRATTSRFLYSILSSLDLLSFWAIALMGIGASKVSRNVSVTKGIATIAMIWAVYVFGKAGFASLF